jgi:DNA polymerase III alpha subunit
MLQTNLLDFWGKSQNAKESFQTEIAETAKLTLESQYIRSPPDDPRYFQRLEEEYALIDKNNFCRVFLQVKKILEIIETIGKETGNPIPHIIRGSAGSSLVCFLLGITHIDPILYGIELARFMNVFRTDIPDIDIDVPYNRRDEIYKRISETWIDQVARISNHVKWKPKTALRESVKTILKEKEKTAEIQLALKLVRKKQYTLAKCLPDQEDQKTALEESKLKIGKLKNYSKHCGGIVIFEETGKIPEHCILQSAGNGNDLAQLHLNKDEVEDAGFIKIDVLCNRGLAQIAEICPSRPFTAYPVRDALTERIFAKGLTLGVTFGESRGMRRIFMEMKPQNVKDIAVALALIRPAAAAEGRKQAFLEKWKAQPIHDDKAGILRPIIFDDDAILKVRKVLSCSSAEADRWRKAFAKGNSKARVEFRQALIERGYSRSIQDTIIDDLDQLVYYSFCKSHAISYAQLVWCLGYWKAHHPHAFWCASLNHCNSEYRKWVHYREARLSGLILSREAPPYKIIQRSGKPTLVSVNKDEQSLLIETETPQQALRDMKNLGYWLTEEFLLSCGVWHSPQLRLDKKREVRFRGLIATGRTVQRGGSVCTLLCIGVANGIYYDLVIANQSRNDLFRWAIVEGKGLLREEQNNTIDIINIHGCSIKSLL